jgi:RNA polymerase sigma-70 factor (ECF subfamily)
VTAASDILRFMTAGRPDAEPEAETSDAREASDAAVAADRQRVEQLYVRLEVKLTNVVVRWLWNREEARDVLQEAFVRLWRMRARIDWERVEPLVFRIALNLAANRRRSRRLWQFVTLSDRAAAPELAGDTGLEQAVQRAIDALPERHRRVLVMSIHSEMTYGEIGEVLGISPGTVGSRRNAALHKLRVLLAREDDDD